MCEIHGRESSESRPSVLRAVGRAVALPFRLSLRVARAIVSPATNAMKSALGQSVPFSNRRHIIIVPEWVEGIIGEAGFAQVRLWHHKKAVFRWMQCYYSASISASVDRAEAHPKGLQHNRTHQ
jgi:hypothetical protein